MSIGRLFIGIDFGGIMSNTRPYIRGRVAIDSFRDNGFKNTAYALAELIDNSLQAKADSVQLVCFEKLSTGKRDRKIVDKIAVFDNGSGMNSETLHLALEFGASENRRDKKGMGKFGMGLPNSSISQCKRVDVWSWTESGEYSYTYLDIDEIKSGDLEYIPIPEKKELPSYFTDSMQEPIPESGTLVVWSNLDRLHWKSSNTIFRHSEALVGRMYRYFISNDSVVIRFRSFVKNGEKYIPSLPPQKFKANDPLYLMRETSMDKLPTPYSHEPFFEERTPESIDVDYKGEVHQVIVRSSFVNRSIFDAIKGTTNGKPGSTVWGRNLATNQGISVLRAGRELELKNEFVKKGEKYRWYGIEVEFPPALDEVFGVLNNKQSAVNFHNTDLDEDAEREGFENPDDYKNELKDTDDPLLHLYAVTARIRSVARNLEKECDGLDFGKSIVPGNNSSPSSKITSASQGRAESGNHASSDDSKPSIDDIKGTLLESGYSEKEADETSKIIIDRELKYFIDVKNIDSQAFFDVSRSNGFCLILINSRHAFYEKVMQDLGSEQQSMLELVVAAWARMEDESPSRLTPHYQTARQRWGEVLTSFLSVDED